MENSILRGAIAVNICALARFADAALARAIAGSFRRKDLYANVFQNWRAVGAVGAVDVRRLCAVRGNSGVQFRRGSSKTRICIDAEGSRSREARRRSVERRSGRVSGTGQGQLRKIRKGSSPDGGRFRIGGG